MIRESDSTSKVSEASGGYLIGLAQGQPSPEEQLAFLAKLQRIFEEGEFTATYKFALLVALTELAVERGGDDNRALPLQIRWIAEKFAELYWPQTIEYSTGAVGTTPALLAQNLGATARVVSVLTNLRRSSGASTIAMAKRSVQWDAALREIAHTVRAQPLKYLQNVGGATVPFLYQFAEEPGWIELRPGVASNLRNFQGLVHQIARAGWVRHVRENPRNTGAIGAVGDLDRPVRMVYPLPSLARNDESARSLSTAIDPARPKAYRPRRRDDNRAARGAMARPPSTRGTHA